MAEQSLLRYMRDGRICILPLKEGTQPSAFRIGLRAFCEPGPHSYADPELATQLCIKGNGSALVGFPILDALSEAELAPIFAQMAADRLVRLQNDARL